MYNSFLLVIKFLALAIATIVSPAIANPLKEYCFSPNGTRQESRFTLPEPRKSSISPSSVKKRVQITFQVQGDFFQAIVVTGRSVQIRRLRETIPLAKVKAPQEFGRIKELTLIEGGNWLWIDGEQTDYIAHLNRNQIPPALETPVALPQLYTRTCPFWRRLLGSASLTCGFRAQGRYSPTLDRVFITGHPPTVWGRSQPIAYEMVEGEAKLLPAPAEDAHLEFELPKLGGVVLRSPDQEAFFYDGTTVTTLLEGSRASKGWHIEGTENPERTFITGEPPFLMELEPGPKLKPISFPEEISENPRELFTLPNDSRLWGITRHRILAEVENSLKTIAVAPAPYFIKRPLQTEDGSISFLIGNEITGDSTAYFLNHADKTNNCLEVPNPETPILERRTIRRASMQP